MLRWLIVLAGATALLAFDARPAWAADEWPDLGVPFARGGGSYLAIWKLLLSWLVFLCWVRTTDWVSIDSQAMKLRWTLWNSIVFFSFFLAQLLFWTIPIFFVGLAILLIGYIVPLATYIIIRNKGVKSSGDKILSRRHIRRLIASRVNKIGIKMEGAEEDPREQGPPIEFAAQGAADQREDSINLIKARQSPGYLPARILIDDVLRERATHLMLDYTPEAVGVRFQIDGVWQDRAGLEREQGDQVLAVFKSLAALNAENRRARQSGSFGIKVEKDKYNCKITSQGTQTGERALLQLDSKGVQFKTLDDIGMRTKMQEQVQALLEQRGLFIFCSLPSGGLTTTIDLALSNTDRYVRNFVEVLEATKQERELENIHVTHFSAAEGETAASILPKLIRTYPDVIVLRDVPDVETLAILCEQAGENRLLVTTIRAKEATEALLRFLMLKIPPADFANAVTGVLNVRLVRMLCENCKEGYSPSAEVLKQLGLPAGRVETLYRPPTEPIDPKHPEVVCSQCSGTGYFGRTGIFELLVIDDTIREVLTTAPKMDKLRLAARKGKQRSLQEEGVLLVARGVTSIPELLRVLKQ